MATKSASKLELKKFLEATPIGGTYTFFWPGNRLQAEQHVANMRSHLSRIKHTYKVTKRKYTEFKINIKEIEETQQEHEGFLKNGHRVTIERGSSDNADGIFADFKL